MTTRTVKLLIAFQGTRYLGWQSQRNGKTVQEIFEAQLARILKEKVNVHGSSRTDAGVHAKGFVAHFKTKSGLTDAKIKDALNFYLPKDIVVLASHIVPDGFHARFSAVSKTYQYEIWNHRTRPAYDKAPYVLWVTKKLDVSSMQKAAKRLVGKHDFNAFRDRGEEERRTIRVIRGLTVTQSGPLIAIRVTANGFLKHMIRVMTGTLIEVGRGKLSIKDIETVVKYKDRKKAGPTVKPQGLTLLKVRY